VSEKTIKKDELPIGIMKYNCTFAPAFVEDDIEEVL